LIAGFTKCVEKGGHKGKNMKPDMDLIRKILLLVEAWPPDGGNSSFPELGYPHDVIIYNVAEAINAGLLDGITEETSDGLDCRVFGLAPKGRESLDDLRQ
jgi:hypothetical protein